ncbi:hypothetical protein D3C86_1342110 [compost metagenome]
MLHRHQHRVIALNVQEGFLLSGKRGVRHVFCGGRGTHGERGLRVVGRELVISIVNGFFQLRLERCVDDPLADLCTGFVQRGNIINIRLIQQVVNALVNTALV